LYFKAPVSCQGKSQADEQYARDMDEIHALGAAVCMATGGAKQIAGGNWQVFDRMLKDAKADVRLSTMVSHSKGATQM
jgi:hypothetical protein